MSERVNRDGGQSNYQAHMYFRETDVFLSTSTDLKTLYLPSFWFCEAPIDEVLHTVFVFDAFERKLRNVAGEDLDPNNIIDWMLSKRKSGTRRLYSLQRLLLRLITPVK